LVILAPAALVLAEKQLNAIVQEHVSICYPHIPIDHLAQDVVINQHRMFRQVKLVKGVANHVDKLAATLKVCSRIDST
jgi:hypothetical protein